MANSCEDFIIKKYIIGGEDGPIGPVGPPGPGVTYPIAATNISVTNAGYANLQEVLDALLYIEFTIDSFTSGTSLYENRDSADASADFIIAFTWAYNKTVIAQTLVGPAEMTPVSLTVGERAKSVTMTDFNTTSIFTLSGTDEQGIVKNSNRTITFTDAIYYGDAAIPGLIDGTFINSLTKSLQTSNNLNTSSNTGASTYFWFATPVSRGTPTFMVSGFPASMEAPTVVSFTNNLGYTTNYNVYRATNSNLGAITYNVT